MSRFGNYAHVMGTDMDADAERAAEERRLRELDAADEHDAAIDAGVNLTLADDAALDRFRADMGLIDNGEEPERWDGLS